ncbi:hypothetical protein OK016_24445 [Vibrio chagasii]|nr:hypothetical protein [Vibrio chagasii]
MKRSSAILANHAQLQQIEVQMILRTVLEAAPEQIAKLLSLLEAYDNDGTQYVSELLIEHPDSSALKEGVEIARELRFEGATEVLSASQP